MNIFKKKHELFRITEGDSAFCLTTANRFITHNNEVYEPSAVERTTISLKSEMEKQSVTISLDLNNKVAQRYLTTNVETLVGLTIFENYDGDTQVIWKGRLVMVSTDGATVKLKFENGATMRNRAGAYRRYQRTCPHALYGTACRLNKADFAISGTVHGMGKQTIQIVTDTALPLNYLSGGIAENDQEIMRYINKNTAGESITVEGQTKYLHTLTIMNSFTASDLTVGQHIQVYPGCDHAHTTCADKFNNIVNFGGFPFMPNNNPFVGTII